MKNTQKLMASLPSPDQAPEGTVIKTADDRVWKLEAGKWIEIQVVILGKRLPSGTQKEIESQFLV
jgi:hypothetical protein